MSWCGSQTTLLPSGLSPTILLLLVVARKITPRSFGAGCPIWCVATDWSFLMYQVLCRRVCPLERTTGLDSVIPSKRSRFGEKIYTLHFIFNQVFITYWKKLPFYLLRYSCGIEKLNNGHLNTRGMLRQQHTKEPVKMLNCVTFLFCFCIYFPITHWQGELFPLSRVTVQLIKISLKWRKWFKRFFPCMVKWVGNNI